MAICAALTGAALWIPSVALTADDLYRWVDEEGFVQFSDRPPDTVPPGGYEGPKPPTIGEALEQRRAEELAALEAERQAAIEAEEAEEAAAAAAPPPPAPRERVISRYDCEQARNMVLQYSQPGLALYSQNADGTFRSSTAAEIQASLVEWQAAAELLCREDVEIVAEQAPPAAAADAEADEATEGAETADEPPDTAEPIIEFPVPDQEPDVTAAEG